MKNKFAKTTVAIVLIATMLVGCGSTGQKQKDVNSNAVGSKEADSKDADSKAADSKEVDSGEKKTFTIYNAAGAPGYHEQVVLKKFKEEFGDKYDIQYETISGPDVVAKIEAQGLQKGNGNVNIVMSGDSDIVTGLGSGIWADLSGEANALNITDLTDLGKQVWDSYDSSAVPISIEPSQSAITYMPDTEKGKIIDVAVGVDGAITYDEIIKLFNDNPDMKLGCGRFPKSGPEAIFAYGMMKEFDKYNTDEVPQNSIVKMKTLYANGRVNLYEGTSDTFKDLTAGNVDMTPHTLSWFYRLYALKMEESTLTDNLKVDALGLENAKFAYIVDENNKPLPAILTNHCYLIPSNLSDEDYNISMEFMKWVTQPEMNAEVLTVLAAPSYKSATPDLIKDEDVKLVWNAVQKYYPEQFLEEVNGIKKIKTTDRVCLMPVTDVGINNTLKTAWQEQLESKIK
ncbi:extracellular solute-binding protein [Lachnoclostridium sp.]|uniref:extracellular solute-binding protein n=1 Tax=Lachnoclostridium sp. TaxID=2028282 RepID=UPI00289E2D19|nr:extracellular solute-binding protein [Lachnoclostridium sp.]